MIERSSLSCCQESPPSIERKITPYVPAKTVESVWKEGENSTAGKRSKARPSLTLAQVLPPSEERRMPLWSVPKKAVESKPKLGEKLIATGDISRKPSSTSAQVLPPSVER